MRSSGTASWFGALALSLLVGGCTSPVVDLEAPAEVETCQWLVPVGIELVNDYVYTLLETDLGATGGDPAFLPTSLIALNARGEELDTRAIELECDIDLLNEAIVEATAGIESDDPVVRAFLDTVRGGVVGGVSAYGEWVFVGFSDTEAVAVPSSDHPITLVIDASAASGSAGCNGYYYPAILSGGHWVWSEEPATITQLLCIDDSGAEEIELMAAEEAYVLALRSIDSYQVDGDTLTLTGESVELHYVRAEQLADSAGN